MWGQRRWRWTNNNVKQTLGYPYIVKMIMQPCLWHADYVIMQPSSIKSDNCNMSLKKLWTIKMLKRLLMIT